MKTIPHSIKTPDGNADATEYAPDGAGPFPTAIFLMDALGIRPAMHTMAQRLCSSGFRVLLPNLYWRAGAFEPFDPKTVWTDQPARERLGKIRGMTTTEQQMADIGAYIDFLGAKKVGTVGYCMGGMLAFSSAIAHPDRVAAAAAIHAGHLVTDKPDSPHLGAAKIKGRIYVGQADNDASFSAAHRATLEEVLGKAGVRHEIELYAGVLHGFAVPDFPVFDARAAEKHWERVTTLFHETLR